MAINKKLIHFKNKENFENEVANNNILDTSICFIQDTLQIYTHGTFYDGSTVDLSNIEASIENILNTISEHQDVTDAAIANKQDKGLKFTELNASSWIEDSYYADYPYRCDLACSGVSGTDYAEVVFYLTDAISGNYAPICETKDGIVSIWSAVNEEIIIPTILIVK